MAHMLQTIVVRTYRNLMKGKAMDKTDRMSTEMYDVPTTATFTCRYENEHGELETWKGEWRLKSMRAGNVEMVVNARGYRYLLEVGCYSDGHYVCLPDWDAGSALASLDDYLWNYPRLLHCMKPRDAVSVIKGLQSFAMETGWGLR